MRKAIVSSRFHGAVIATLATTFAANAAAADTTSNRAFELNLTNSCNEGRKDGDMERRGPGHEQTRGTPTEVEGKQFLVYVTMKSTTENGLGFQQPHCISVELTAQGPQIVASKQIARVTGDRIGHPSVFFSDAANPRNGWITYGTNGDTPDGRTQTYAVGIDNQCNVRTTRPQLLTIVRDDSNNGAGEVESGVGGTAMLCTYNDGNTDQTAPGTIGTTTTRSNFPNQKGDFTLCALIKEKVNPATQEPLLDTPAEARCADTNASCAYADPMPYYPDPAVARVDWHQVNTHGQNVALRIGRPKMARNGSQFMVVVAEGGGRPAMNVIAATFDATTMAFGARTTIFQGDGPKKIYYNSPSIGVFGDGRYAISAGLSNAAGKNSNVKGSTTQNLAIVDGAGNIVSRAPEAYSAHSTHHVICTGSMGVVDKSVEPTIFTVGAAPSGVGRGMVDVVHFGVGGDWRHDVRRDRVAATYFGDSGFLSNRYGRNPMRQGRDHMGCVGDIKNPGYGVEGGFMPGAKTLTMVTVQGRGSGFCEKNDAFASFLPSITANELGEPENPDFKNNDGSAITVEDKPVTPVAEDGGCNVAGGAGAPGTLGGVGVLVAGLTTLMNRLRKRSRRG